MTRDEVEQVAEMAVLKTLTSLGIDVRRPTEAQADFQALREWRLLMKAMRRALLTALIGVTASGALAALWIGIKTLWKS